MGTRLHHIGLFVQDLQSAERFFTDLFDMELLFRESRADDGSWWTLPAGSGWGEARTAGITIDMVALRRDEFVLPIFEGTPHPGTVIEIGVLVPPSDVELIKDRLIEAVIEWTYQPGSLYLKDPFGYTWNIVATGEAFLSNGEVDGRWLDL